MFKWIRQPAAKTFKARSARVSTRLSHAVFVGFIAIAVMTRPVSIRSDAFVPKISAEVRQPSKLAKLSPALDIALKRPPKTALRSVIDHDMRRLAALQPSVRAEILKPTTVLRSQEPTLKIVAKSVDGAIVSDADVSPVQSTAADVDHATPAPIGVVKKSSEYTVVNVWSDQDVAEGRKACAALLKGIDLVSTEIAPVKEGACGAPAPIEVHSLGAPKVSIQPPAMLTCPMAAALHKWITDKVQPAALASFGVPVVRLLSASSYACRNRYGRSDAPLSEHALVNALDLSGFMLSDGRTIRVLESWGPVSRDKPRVPGPAASLPSTATAAVRTAGMSSLGAKTDAGPLTATATVSKAALVKKSGSSSSGQDQDGAKSEPKDSPQSAENDASNQRMSFLHKVHQEACDVFGTVLGPEANDAHRNHFHLDMKARLHKSYCQ